MMLFITYPLVHKAYIVVFNKYCFTKFVYSFIHIHLLASMLNVKFL